MTRRPVAVVALLVVGFAATPGEAKHRRAITKQFSVKGTAPYFVDGGMCDTAVHGKDRHVEKFRAPEVGKLVVELTGFYGDFDLMLTDDKGRVLTEGNNETSTSGVTPGDGTSVETLTYTVRKAQSLQIHACNYAASPDATGKYTYTFTR